MKKIIRMGLLSTVGFCNLISGANPLEPNEDGIVMGDPVQTRQGAEAPISEDQMAYIREMSETIVKGCIPEEILELFSGLPKIDVSQRANSSTIEHMQNELRSALERRWTDKVSFVLNIFLSGITNRLSPKIVPFAAILFGEMTEEGVVFAPFIKRVFHIYTALFSDARNTLTIPINTPLDWVTVQFLGLLFDNVPSCVVDLNTVGLGRLGLIKVVEELKDSTLNILGVWGLHDDVQIDVLKAITEIRPKKAKIISDTPNVAFFKSFIDSLTNPDLQEFIDGSKVEVMLAMDLAELNRHQAENSAGLSLHQREAALIEMFESTVSRVVPHVWDIQLVVRNFESIAHGNLTSLIRALVRSPIGRNLSLPTLVSDHVSTSHVMTKLMEELLTPESRVQTLNFEGSELSAEGWEQLAQLAESRKPFERVRLTGMQIPRSIASRLGMLRSVGINMPGCNVNAADLTDMVSGWLGEGSILRGVDMRGNEVNEVIARKFLENGFNGYGDQHSGFMFIKP